MDTGDEQPSTNCMTRVKSLQQYASAITELVNEKVNVAKKIIGILSCTIKVTQHLR
jgi:serine/threonine-protein kinase ULK/ATG1